MTATLADRDIAAEFEQLVRREFGSPAAAPAEEAGLVGVWLTHRVCAEEHQTRVYARCLTDRRVLPRWHQDDRGPRNHHRGFHVEAPAGAYRGVDAWMGRDHWLAVVVPLAIQQRPEVLRRHGVSPDVMRRWARVKSGYAAQKSGRRCIVRPVTVASVVGVTERQVQRCNAAARELGLEQLIMEGRMLDVDERSSLRSLGSRQRGLASEVALTIPSWLRHLVGSVTPSRGSWASRNSHLCDPPHDGLRPIQKDGAPRRRNEKGVRSRWRARSVASELAVRLDWLAGEARRRLIPPLMRFVTADEPWTVDDLVAGIRQVGAGRGEIQPDMIRTRPAILLAGILRRLDPVADHPRLAGPFIPSDTAPCGGADCDGYGWINGLDDTGRPWAKPCPDCAPAVRRGAAQPPVDPWAAETTPGTSGHPF